MDRRERIGDDEESLRLSFDSAQGQIWTSLPGIITSFDPVAMTCSVQPSIKGLVRAPDGSLQSVNLPVLQDCPVEFPGGGGCTLTFPINPGDEALIVFASRCINAWWALGGVQEPEVARMHDLSDGFVLVGHRSRPRAFAVSTTAAQLRTDDGAAYVEINPASHKIKAQTSGDIEANAVGRIAASAGGDLSATAGGNASVTAGGAIALTAPTITLKGSIVLDGPISQANTAGGGSSASLIGPLAVTNDVTAGGKSLKTHVHSGVTAGGSNTGQPV